MYEIQRIKSALVKTGTQSKKEMRTSATTLVFKSIVL